MAPVLAGCARSSKRSCSPSAAWNAWSTAPDLAKLVRAVLAQGILLGGLFTLLHSVVRSLVSQDTLVTFGVVTVALVVVLYLGYHRFVDRPTETGDDREPLPVVVSENGKHPSRRR